jgi:hypothetical protein
MSEYRFDRYRNGRRMAEGLVLTKPTSVDQAVAVAAALAQSGEIYVMRQESRIAELEAERDAAKAGEASEKSLHDKTIAERNAAENQLQCALAERDAAKAEAVDLYDEVQNVWCDLEASGAREARSVEALRKIWGEDIQPFADGLIEDLTCCYCDGNSAEGCDEDCPRFIAYEAFNGSQPALHWLAQREREAAARELEQLMESEWKWEEFELKAIIHARIAALTNQQPTACPRSEVWGKERFRA